MELQEVGKNGFYRLYLLPDVSKEPIDVQFIAHKGYTEIKEINTKLLEEMETAYKENFDTIRWLGLITTSDNQPAIMVCKKLKSLQAFDVVSLKEAELIAIPNELIDWKRSDHLIRTVYYTMRIAFPGLDGEDEDITEEVINSAISENMRNIIYLPDAKDAISMDKSEKLVLGSMVSITMNAVKNAKRDLEEAKQSARENIQDERNYISNSLEYIRVKGGDVDYNKERLKTVFEAIKAATAKSGTPSDLDGYTDFDDFYARL